MATRRHAGCVYAAAKGERQSSVSTRIGLRTEPRALAFAVGAALFPLTVAAPAYADVAANTLPTGGQYAYGSGSITQQAGNKLQITQTTDKGTVNWNTFSIGASAAVNFTQPSASSITLNRVLGNNPSEIFGRMTANGQVFLSNPNGVLFAPGASVNVGALFATTLTLSDQDANAGRYTKWTNPGNSGAVINQGNIVTANGYTALAGPQVKNDGLIVAHAGSVTLAAGNQVSLDMVGDGLIKVTVDQAALNASAINSGSIQADGGNVLLTARSANALLDTVVNNTGIIRANSLVERNGEIVLDGGTSGVVSNSGTLQAAGTDAGTTGGTVKVLGQYVGLFDGTRIDASGDAGGGTVLVGGNYHGAGPEQNASMTYFGGDASIIADAITAGNGGNVAVWSNDGTKYYGDISARGGARSGNGGFVEVSGKHDLAFAGTVDTRAPTGRTGMLLLDPDEIIIDNTADTPDLNESAANPDVFTVGATIPAHLTWATIDNRLGATDVTVQTSTNDITIAATGSLTNPNTLWLDSAAAVNIDFSITSSAATNFRFTGTSINFGANLTTKNGNVQFDNPTTLTAGVAVDTVNGGTGGNITLTSTLAGGTNTLDLTAGSGDIAFNGVASGLGTTTIHTARNVSATTFTADSLTQTGGSGTTTLNGLVATSAAAGVDITNAVVVANGGINAATTGSVNLHATAGSVSVGANLITGDQGVTLSADTATGSVSTVLGGAIAATNGAVLITAQKDVTLNDTVTSGTTVNINFGGAVTGVFTENSSIAPGSTATVTGGANGNTFTINSATTASLVGGTGADTFNINAALTGSVNGGAGSDTLQGTQIADVTMTGSGVDGYAGTLATVANLSGGFSNIDVINGTGTITGESAAASTWTLAASQTYNDGGAATLTFSGFGTAHAGNAGDTFTVSSPTAMNLIGGTGADTFTLAGGTLSGSVDGLGGGDTLAGSTAYSITGADSGTAAGVTGGFTNIANLSGTTGADTFTLAGGTLSGSVDGLGGGDTLAGSTAYSITGADSGTATGVTGGFTNVANLTGTAGNDTFTLGAAGSLSGTIDGLGQATADTLNVAAKAGETVNLSGSTTSIAAFANIESIVGATTLAGGTTWSITGANSGTVDGVAFSGVPNVAGTAGADTFTLAGGTLSGTINGVSGSDTLTGDNVANTWTITGANSGTLTGTGGWSNIPNLVGGSNTDSFTLAGGTLSGSINGGGGTNTLAGSTAYSITGADSGTAAGVTGGFTNIANLSGTAGADTFTLAGGTLSGSVNGGGGGDTLAGSTTYSITGADSGTAAGVTGGFTNIANLSGTAGADTFTLAGGTLSGTINGGVSGSDTLTGDNVANTWTITGANSGTLTGTGGWSNISNLVGGSSTDSFSFAAAGSVAGSVDGGAGLDALNVSAKTGALTIDLQASTAPGIGTTFANLESFIGSGVNTTLVGPNAGATFTLTGADSGTVSAFSYSGVGNLTGGSGADTFTGGGGSLTGNLVDGGGATTLNGAINTAGTQTYTGSVTLGSATTLASTGNLAVSFSSTVDGAQSLAVNTTGATTFLGVVGGGAALTSLTTNVGGTSSSVGVTTIGATTFNDNTTLSGTYNDVGFTAAGSATLAGATTINAGAGNATFTGSVSGAFSLAVNSNTLESFGSTINVASISTDAPGSVSLGGNVTTTGNQTFLDQVSAGAISLNAGSGAVSATNAANDFTGVVTLTAGTASLVDANALAVSLNTTGATSLTAGTTLTANGTSGSLTTVSIGGGTNFGALTVNGNLNATSGGAVAQGAAMTVTGSTAINAGANSVTLTSVNDFQGAVSVTGGTTQITDVNALTLGGLNTGALTVIDTGALNLGTGTVNGALVATSNGGNVTESGGITVTGTSNIAAAAGSIMLASANDFGGAVTAGGTAGISLNDVNGITPASINAGAGAISLTAGAINAGGPLAASSLTLGSNASVATVTFSPTLAGKNVLLTGTSSSWTFCDVNGCGTSMTPPVFSKTSTGPVDIFFNGVNLGSSAATVQNVVGSIAGTASQIAAQALQEALDTDSVQKQIDYGFAGDVGMTPPMDHRIDDTGISVPECFEQSREGEPCK